jgi:hypothetical protein
MKQIKVSIPNDILAQLEDSANRDGVSLSEAVRNRLVWTADRVDLGRPDIGALVDKIAELAILAEGTTEQRWDNDPATAYLLQLAIAILLRRHGAREVAQIPTSEIYQREGLVQSNDPTVLATAMEALVSFKLHRLDDGRLDLKELRASVEAKIRERGKQ